MNRLKELRSERNLSMRGMEIKTGIKYNTYSRYESSERDMSTEVLKKLASFFEVTVDYLINYNGYCLYVKYENGNFCFTIKESYYNEIKEKYIYFDNEDNRCIDLNSLVGVDSNVNLIGLVQEVIRIDIINTVFKKNNPKIEYFDELDNENEKIELTRRLIKKIKDTIR